MKHLSLPGLLRGQAGKKIRFARAPNTLNFNGGPSFGVCSGWTNKRCNTRTRFANDDIYFLEICFYNQICSNGDALFQLQVGEDFECDLDDRRFRALQQQLLASSESR